MVGGLELEGSAALGSLAAEGEELLATEMRSWRDRPAPCVMGIKVPGGFRGTFQAYEPASTGSPPARSERGGAFGWLSTATCCSVSRPAERSTAVMRAMSSTA